MEIKDIRCEINRLSGLRPESMFEKDFLLTWDKTDGEIRSVLLAADLLRAMRKKKAPLRAFESGLAVSLFRDNSTRTRFSFTSACNLLGLEVQDLDEGKSQIAHGETVRETATMISFMAEVIGIRDDMYIGKGNTYMRSFADALDDGYHQGVLEQRPAVINLQCDIDHPTQSLSDALHLANCFGGVENLRGKKLAMTWAYSPSYGKPLSVPQGVIGLMSRFGMDIVLAHPPGYEVMEDVVALASKQADATGGSFRITGDMADAFAGADIVYPKSWAPFLAMEKRTALWDNSDPSGIGALEKELLAQNAEHKDWECTDKLMATTRASAPAKEAVYLHCLPADISGVSCAEGEVAAAVFDRHRISLYKQAGNKPYIIAAMILLSRCKDPGKLLSELASAAL